MQAGSEVSALLGRMPSAVGYQPTLATEMGALEERITSTHKGSITSVQAVYVPADDYTDPAVATTFAISTRRPRCRGRSRSSASIRPSIRWRRPRAFSIRRSSATSITASRAACKKRCSATRICKTSSRFSASKNSRKTTSASSAARAALQRFFSQPFFVAEQFTGRAGKYVKLADTIASFKEVLDGKLDHLPEQAFYMAGGIDEVKENAEKMGAKV